MRSQNFHDVDGGHNDERVLILLDLAVRLTVRETRRYDDPELTVTKPGDQPGHLADADRIPGDVAFGLKREIGFAPEPCRAPDRCSGETLLRRNGELRQCRIEFPAFREPEALRQGNLAPARNQAYAERY